MKPFLALLFVLVITVLPVEISSGSEAGTILRILDGVVGQQAEQEHQTREQEEMLREREEELDRRERELERKERQVYERETLLREREQKLELEKQRHTRELKRRERELEHRKRQAYKQRDTEQKSSTSRRLAVPTQTSSKNGVAGTNRAVAEIPHTPIHPDALILGGVPQSEQQNLANWLAWTVRKTGQKCSTVTGAAAFKGNKNRWTIDCDGKPIYPLSVFDIRKQSTGWIIIFQTKERGKFLKRYREFTVK